jgi:hypothetical protein
MIMTSTGDTKKIMNTSTYTTAQLRAFIPIMVAQGRGITVNECGFDPDLDELDENTPIVIKSAEESNGCLTVEFEQSYDGDDGFDNLDAWTWKYTTVQEVELIKSYLNVNEPILCQCLHEIENELLRTKFCMVPCRGQLEMRRKNRTL